MNTTVKRGTDMVSPVVQAFASAYTIEIDGLRLTAADYATAVRLARRELAQRFGLGFAAEIRYDGRYVIQVHP